MSDPQPPLTRDIISMFNNLVKYLKSKTIDDKPTKEDVENVISTSEHIMTYLSTLKKEEEENKEQKEEEQTKIADDSVHRLPVQIGAVTDDFHIGINVNDGEVGRTLYFKMTPHTSFQKVFSSFVKRTLYANSDDSVDIKVKTSFIFFSFS
jgi:hypothetical protein